MTKTITMRDDTRQPEPFGQSPDAIAYRMGEVEKAISRVGDKLDVMAAGFVTHADIDVLKAQAKLDHDAIYKEIQEVDVRVRDIQKWKDTIINRIAYTAVVGLVIAVLAFYGLDKLFKL